MALPSDKLRVCAGFFMLGLINNILYVLLLSAALDLVGPTIPKGVVLLADVLPSFLVKLTAPYYIHVIPYGVRVWICVALSAGGMLVVALSGDAQPSEVHSPGTLVDGSPMAVSSGAILLKLLGIALASLSSGGGELSFLGLTHFYGHASLAAWSSGTGAAGLVGAGAYVLATTTFGLSSRGTLLVSAVLPLVMVGAFFGVLPTREGVGPSASRGGYQRVAGGDEHEGEGSSEDERRSGDSDGGRDNLRRTASIPVTKKSSSASGSASMREAWQQFRANLHRARGLFLPYMLPLLLVYVAEYTINQGVAPTLLFPLKDTPFSDFRDFYPTYNAIYQLGVFISRSSTPFLRIHHLYVPSILQVANLALLTIHAFTFFLPSVWIVFAIVFWEGLLGGLVYVNTFAEISDNVPLADREFSLSATTVSDSGGICIAAFVSMAFETALCDWQVRHGRDWCRKP